MPSSGNDAFMDALKTFARDLKSSYGSLVASLASYLIFFYMVLLAASQFVAWGKFVGPIIDENYPIAIIIGALIVILYSYIGGYI